MSVEPKPELLEEPGFSDMFASVWVKAELDDDPKSEMQWNQEPPSADENPFVAPPKKAKTKRKPTTELKCDLCQYSTVYRNCLKVHMMGHFNVKPYVCELCGYSSKYLESLHRHTAMKHHQSTDQPSGNIPALTCNHCDYTTYFRWNLNAHKRKHKLEKQYKCSHCEYQTAYRQNFVKHFKTHNTKVTEVFKCDKCPFVTKFAGHIQRHLAKIHNEISEKANLCDLCGFSTHVKWRLNIHKQRSKQSLALKCAYCDFETYYMCERKKHNTTHYGEIFGTNKLVARSSIPSEIRSMIIAKQIGSKDHKPNSTEQSNDPQCAAQTSSANDVGNTTEDNSETIDTLVGKDYHSVANNYMLDPKGVNWKTIEVLTTSDKERPFQCPLCSYMAKFKATVRRHYQRHHTDSQTRPYKCLNCDFSTKTKDQISLHSKRSKSEFPIQCPMCEYMTIFKCTLVAHQKTHYVNKCKECGYTCKQKYELTKHYLTFHLDDGIKCQYCDFKAARKDTIVSHESIHTGIKPFKCEFCGYMSVRKCLLDNHVRRYHRGIQNDMVLVSSDKIDSLKFPISDAINRYNNVFGIN